LSGGKIKGVVGDTFPTPKGGYITLEQRIKGFWLVSCSICSKDTEMFPDLFKVSSCSLSKGVPSCGCNNHTRLNKRQQTLRAARLASKRGYILEGFVTDNWTTKGKLKLYNPSNGNRWETACIGSLLSGEGCPIEGRSTTGNKNTRPLVDVEQQVRAAGTLQDHHRLKEVNNKSCLLICEKCAVDEYSKGGVCNGVFLTKKSYLKEGWLPCRCSSSPKYTMEQKEFKAKSLIESEEGEFISLGADRVTLSYICKEGHHCKPHYNSYVNDNDRCRTCYSKHDRSLGFYKQRALDIDHLYVINMTHKEDSFLKIGRTFEIERRYQQYRRVGYTVEELIRFEGLHKNVYPIEQTTHQLVDDHHINPELYFKGCKNECFSLEALPYALEYLNSCKDLTSL
tara:strand:+ start:7044 stop:8231 length:1188 start_codon:yes stop_codon:yes gene_type:complete